MSELWEQGACCFNEGKYWDAHERWERGWTLLQGAARDRIKACIQTAGILHLLGQGRLGPIRPLCARALELWSSADPGAPTVQIPNAPQFLEALQVALVSDPSLGADRPVPQSPGAVASAFSEKWRLKGSLLKASVVDA